MDLGFENGQKYWREQALFDAKRNRELRYQHGHGPCNIFILDTSSSLGEEGFRQMKETFCTIIKGYANHPEEDENVAVIVCGKNTRFQHHFSNQYLDIAQCLDSVEYGGLSPLTAAFLLCIESTRNGASHTLTIGDFKIRPRVILISDGRPTNFHIISDANDSILQETEEAKNNLQQLVRIIGRRNPIFCIPVGNNPDMPFLEFICAQSKGGKIVYPHEAMQFARYSQNMRTASLLASSTAYTGVDQEMALSALSCVGPGKFFTEMDKEDIFELYAKKSVYTSEPSNSDDDEVENEHERKDPRMPDLGNRVKRGPDWMWENQDTHGPGTVTGYSKRTGWLWVEWDNGGKNMYRYGNTIVRRDVYDVIVCDTPRVLVDEFIATGCLVQRGRDWTWGDQDGGEGNIGSIFGVRPNGSVHVRWPNGNEKQYRFGCHGKLDLQLCDPFSQEAVDFLQETERKAFEKIRGGASSNFSDYNVFKVDNSTHVDSESASPEYEFSKHSSFSNSSTQLLKIPKGKYFKNDRTEDELSSDVETDGPIAFNQWMWKDSNGKWNPYPRKMNDKIWKSWKRNPTSTVVVEINDCVYRVVLEKSLQINLMTKETMEVKLVENS